MHIHDDLQDVIARDTDISYAMSGGGVAAFKANLGRRFGSYRLVRDVRSVQQNLVKKLNAAAQSGSPGIKPETPVRSEIKTFFDFKLKAIINVVSSFYRHYQVLKRLQI